MLKLSQELKNCANNFPLWNILSKTNAETLLQLYILDAFMDRLTIDSVPDQAIPVKSSAQFPQD